MICIMINNTSVSILGCLIDTDMNNIDSNEPTNVYIYIYIYAYYTYIYVYMCAYDNNDCCY